MATCNRHDAVNYGEEGDCMFLVRKQTASAMTITDQRMDTTTTNPSYKITLSGGIVAGEKLKITINYGTLPQTVSVTYEVEPGDGWTQVVLGITALFGALPGSWSVSSSGVGPVVLHVENDGGTNQITSGLAAVIGGEAQCHSFTQVDPTDRSLTICWYPSRENWMFFHDYSPSVYFRDKIDSFCIDSANFYRMNKGSRGLFTTDTRKPFIIDLVFRWEGEVIINHVSWQSMIAAQPFTSFSHITVSTREFSTGRVAIGQRRVQGWFSFNKLRDVVISLPFKDDVYSNFDVMSAAVDQNTAWFKRGLLEDNHCIVRLEYDGSDNIVFLGAETNQDKAFR